MARRPPLLGRYGRRQVGRADTRVAAAVRAQGECSRGAAHAPVRPPVARRATPTWQPPISGRHNGPAPVAAAGRNVPRTWETRRRASRVSSRQRLAPPRCAHRDAHHDGEQGWAQEVPTAQLAELAEAIAEYDSSLAPAPRAPRQRRAYVENWRAQRLKALECRAARLGWLKDSGLWDLNRTTGRQARRPRGGASAPPRLQALPAGI